MTKERFNLPESWQQSIEDFLFRQAIRDDYLLCEAVALFYFPEDLVVVGEDGKTKRKFTQTEALEIDDYVRKSYPGFRLPTVSENICLAMEATGDDLDGEDVIRELGLELNGIGHPVGRGVAEHEGEWAAYWSSTEAREVGSVDERYGYALVASKDGMLNDRQRVEANRRLSIRLVYDLSL